MTMRRAFRLPESDEAFLEQYGCPWETIIDGSHWVLIHDFPTQHPGYEQQHVTAAIRIEAGYPKARLDMVYFSPAVLRIDGKVIKATQHKQTIDGRAFQRWSRHYTKSHPWVIGECNLGTHVMTIEEWLLREFEKEAAECN